MVDNFIFYIPQRIEEIAKESIDTDPGAQGVLDAIESGKLIVVRPIVRESQYR